MSSLDKQERRADKVASGDAFLKRFGSALAPLAGGDRTVQATKLGVDSDKAQRRALEDRGEHGGAGVQQRSRSRSPEDGSDKSLSSVCDFLQDRLDRLKWSLVLEIHNGREQLMRDIVRQELQPFKDDLVLEIQSCKGELTSSNEELRTCLLGSGTHVEDHAANIENGDDEVVAGHGCLEVAEEVGAIQPQASPEQENGEAKILTEEQKSRQLKDLFADFRTACGWKSDKHVHHVVSKPNHDSLVAHSKWQSHILQVTNHISFQAIVAALIIANAITIAVETDQAIRNALKNGHRDTKWSDIIDHYIYTPAFCIELMMRLLGEQAYFFYGPSKKWNVFDVILVLTGVAELIFQTFSFTFLRVIRVFRMLRVMRVIRIFRIFRELRLMVVSIITSMLTLTWAFLLLMLLIFCFAVCFVMGAANHLENEEKIVSEFVRAGIQEDFPSLSHSLYTLLSVISGGKEWDGIAKMLMEIGSLYFYLFVFYIVFIVFGVMNVLTGVFVDSAAELSRFDHDLVIQTEMSRKESFLNQVQLLFGEMDKDSSGTISAHELEVALSDERVLAYLNHLELEITEASSLFRLLDTDENGEIGAEEFMLGCMRLKGQSKNIEMASMIFDQKKNWLLQKKKFHQVMDKLTEMQEQLNRQDLILQGRPIRGSSSTLPVTANSNSTGSVAAPHPSQCQGQALVNSVKATATAAGNALGTVGQSLAQVTRSSPRTTSSAAMSKSSTNV